MDFDLVNSTAHCTLYEIHPQVDCHIICYTTTHCYLNIHSFTLLMLYRSSEFFNTREHEILVLGNHNYFKIFLQV